MQIIILGKAAAAAAAACERACCGDCHCLLGLPSFSLSLSRTYSCHSLVCRGCLSTSHCGTFRLSIALRQLIDAHKSVKRVRRGSRQTLEKSRREGDSSSLSLCLSSSRSFCMPNHCSRKLENFQLTVNFLPLQLPQSNTQRQIAYYLSLSFSLSVSFSLEDLAKPLLTNEDITRDVMSARKKLNANCN